MTEVAKCSKISKTLPQNVKEERYTTRMHTTWVSNLKDMVLTLQIMCDAGERTRSWTTYLISEE